MQQNNALQSLKSLAVHIFPMGIGGDGDTISIARLRSSLVTHGAKQMHVFRDVTCLNSPSAHPLFYNQDIFK